MSTYTNMEEVLKLVNKNYVSLDKAEVKYNNERLRAVLWDIISIMKRQDTIFDKLFERPCFGGSYYDDLKVGKPDEFDLNLLLVLPKVCETHKTKNCGCLTVTPSNAPGFFWFKIKKNYYTPLNEFIKDDCLQTDLVLNWLKGRVTDTLNRLRNESSGSIHQFTVNYDPPSYYSESGPALTLCLWGEFGRFDVDLVPAFKFGSEYWPTQGFRSNVTARSEFFLVPKNTKGMIYGERYWRPSFQDQERELIKSKGTLKPALRLLKKMRNNLIQSSISSYSLKTIVLWEMDTDYFNWNETLSDTFIKLLEKYKDSLQKKRISYYWNSNNNLLDYINPITLENHHNEISALLRKIKDNHMENPCIVAKVILKEGTNEYNEFIAEYNRETKGISLRNSSLGSSYFTFEPNPIERRGNATAPGVGSGSSRRTTQPAVRSSSSGWTTAGERSSDSSRSTRQQTMENSSSGWATAGGIILGIGAVAAVGLSILGALNHNRNQNN